MIIAPLKPTALLIWRVIYGIGIAFEVWNVVDNEPGDTLSEVVVHQTAQYAWLDGALPGFFAWLVIHWSFFHDSQQGMRLVGAWQPAAFVVAGVAMRVLLGSEAFGTALLILVALATTAALIVRFT